MYSSLLAPLPDAPLDIVGDVHGELGALQTLLYHLGYDARGHHPGGRKLVFVGDLCDRGPDSPGVIELVRRIVEEGRGVAVLGNHELNLLRGDRKLGNDWFWAEGRERDAVYHPWRQLAEDQRQSVLTFFSSLPLALERADLRVVHAAWHEPALREVVSQPARGVSNLFDHWEQVLDEQLSLSGLLARKRQELRDWGHPLDDEQAQPPMLPATARCHEQQQMGNPLRVLTSGVERVTREPFYSNGLWRFVERVRWWDSYEESVPVVVGHYWRRMTEPESALAGKGGARLFQGLSPDTWHGRRNNVFCVDFSVGGRFLERQHQRPRGAATCLAALRWPERVLMCEDGRTLSTTAYLEEVA